MSRIGHPWRAIRHSLFVLPAMAGVGCAVPPVPPAAPLELAAPAGVAEGDPVRGRRIVLDRQKGLCLLCHSGPFPEERFQGNLAPDLGGVGTRHSVGRLRLQVSHARRLNPETIMPSYARTDGYTRLAPARSGAPMLSDAQIEDVVAFLATLKERG